MLGAIAGDIIGSVYEFRNHRSTMFPLFLPVCRFTDDTVMTAAIADSILTGTAYVDNLRRYFYLYPQIGYGPMFREWALSDSVKPYGSFGNGSAMRASPIGWAYSSAAETWQQATQSAEATHNHQDGIDGAVAVAMTISGASMGLDKDALKTYVSDVFGYDLDTPLDDIRPVYKFDATCPGSVPQAIRAFLESNDWEHAVRLAVSIGGDSDTIACITGGIAEAFYGGVPETIAERTFEYLDERLARVTREFMGRYCGARRTVEAAG